jgi:hypothetical protein
MADKEYLALRTYPSSGTHAIVRRLAQHPGRYAAWYFFEKPYSLWNWDIQIGQGDIYVFPVANSPFQTQSAWMALAAICRSLNPLLIFLMLASLLFARSKVDVDAHQGRITLISILSLLLFVTIVYSVLQAEPRYSIPFRPYEMLLATTALAGFTAQWRKRRLAKSQLKVAP